MREREKAHPHKFNKRFPSGRMAVNASQFLHCYCHVLCTIDSKLSKLIVRDKFHYVTLL